MGLQSALTTALTGMQAAETSIDVIGNNVANSQTVGFKESEAVFATQFLQTISIGSAPSTNSGGTNPRQIGLGVTVAEISPNFTQGTIEISANPLDVAIQGDGFLIVQSGTDQLFTRNGQLQLNAENEIVTSTGQRVLGYGVNDDYDIITDNLVPLTIPVGEERVAQQTTRATFNGVLNPAVDIGSVPSISQSIVLGDGTVEQPAGSFDITDIAEAEVPPISGLGDTTSGTTGVEAGLLNYRFVYESPDGLEGTVTADYQVDNTGAAPAAQINLTGLVQATSPEFATGQINVYRQDPVSSNYYLVGNTTGTTFADTTDNATLVTGTLLNSDVIESGSYSYYITYFNPDTNEETIPTARIGTTTLESTGKIHLDLSGLTNEVGSEFTDIRIYRNAANTSDYYLVNQSQVVELGTDLTFVDDVPESQLTTNDSINLDGPPASEDTRLVNLLVREGDSYIDTVFEEGVLTINAQKDGVDIDSLTMNITNSSTVLDLLNFLEDSLGIDTESDVTDTPFPTAGNVELIDGRIRITSNLGEENAIEMPLTGLTIVPTGEDASQTVPVTFSETQEANGPGTSTELIVYDSLGLPLNVRITTVLETKTSNSTTYRWYATSGENEPLLDQTTVIGDGLLEFDANGDLVTATQNRISIQRNDTASESPLEVELDFTQVKSLGETDAQGNPISALNFTSQDGFAPGVLTDFIITDDGLIQGQFSNGTQRTVGQLVMARFANNSGLTQVGDSLFDVGVNSGEPIFGTPGEEGIGTLTAGAVELSNTDIGQNLIELILASTQYSGAARVITATQELLDELLALQR